MPSQRPTLSKRAPSVCAQPHGPAEKEWEGSDSSEDAEDEEDQTIQLHAKHRSKAGPDAGDSANHDSLLPTANMFEVYKAVSKAVEADAVPDGVPDLPCSADHGGACQDDCDGAFHGAFHQNGPLTHAGLSEPGRAGRVSGICARTLWTGSLAPQTAFSAFQALPIKRKALASDWEHPQGSVQQRRPSLSEDATAVGRGCSQSLAALRVRHHHHHHHGVSSGTHLDCGSRAREPRVNGHDWRPLSGDSTSSASQGSVTLFGMAAPVCLAHSTAGTSGVLQKCAAPAMVAVAAVANSPWHDFRKGRASELLMIKVRPAF